ncbi:hypothetical protein NM962_01375 [Mycobacterium sp. SVM_VP21]|nr:hypothetical protein NM962_01375 [Mycobacterium sp. SVM_VP21]
MKTYSLAEVAEMILPPEYKCPELWLVRRLNRGQIKGYRVGKTWRMTEEHLQQSVELLSNTLKRPKVPEPIAYPVSVFDAISPRSRARMELPA